MDDHSPSPVLITDKDISFPSFTVLKASAGSGKTHTLTQRLVQFLLSEKIPKNSMQNILAVTFSNNAAREMRERTLLWLKSICFGDPEKTGEISGIVSPESGDIQGKAGNLIDEILGNYADFQVRTIDSFMTSIFKASAIDFGYNPEFDILLSSDAVMSYAFDLFLRDVREGTGKAGLLEAAVRILSEQKKKEAAYLWDPSSALLDEIRKIYRKLSAGGRRPLIEDLSGDMAGLRNIIRTEVEKLEQMIADSGLDRRGNSCYGAIFSHVREGRFPDIIGKGMKNPPVNRPKKGQESSQMNYDNIISMWSGLTSLISRYTALYARSYYCPYLQVYEAFRETVETVKKNQGKVFIEDINRYLSEYLDREVVPDIYFRIGDIVFHFLIDEFQDTSPIQWRNLFPLIENALSMQGSAFIVGDTKQAIYGFREADYTIMKRLESENPFPSAEHSVHELDTNFRSRRKILGLSNTIFRELVPSSDTYREAGDRSGLTCFSQKVREGGKSPGYAEVVVLGRNDEEPPERVKIQELVEGLTGRGFSYGDIAIL
ncbi:MAG: UvrD-helicase domain-containing protein, partial [Nitrospirae bacterium]|nr:UvrD-helicase domain-containing protein [Nitrospirota bacterium]